MLLDNILKNYDSKSKLINFLEMSIGLKIFDFKYKKNKNDEFYIFSFAGDTIKFVATDNLIQVASNLMNIRDDQRLQDLISDRKCSLYLNYPSLIQDLSEIQSNTL